MTDEEFHEFLGDLQQAHDHLLRAGALMDGIDAFAPGGEHALGAALSAIDAVRQIEVAYREQHPESDATESDETSTMSENRVAICSRIQRAREEAGLKQTELADVLHVHWRTVQNWESRIVPWKRLEEIAKATGTSRRWLLDGDEETSEVGQRLDALEAKVRDIHPASVPQPPA